MSKTHKITHLKKRIAELEKELHYEIQRRNVNMFCNDIQMRQLHSFWGRFKWGSFDNNSDILKGIVADAIGGAVFSEPDFIEHYIVLQRSNEHDENGLYTYQWQVTFATKEKNTII